MASRIEIRRRWFELGARALAQYLGNDEPTVYRCPECLSDFTVEAVENGELTEEHVPPESLGGRRILLTCAKCNHEAGYRLDAHAARRDGQLAAIQGLDSSAQPVTMTSGEESLRGNVRFSGQDSVLMLGVPQANPPGVPPIADFPQCGSSKFRR